jgi:fused signal recognition particle receptor
LPKSYDPLPCRARRASEQKPPFRSRKSYRNRRAEGTRKPRGKGLGSGASAALLLKSHPRRTAPMISLFGSEEPQPSLLDRLKKSVSKTRSEIASRVEGLFTGGRRLDPEDLQRLENALLATDLGVRTTREMIDAVRQAADHEPLRDAAQLRGALKKQLLGILGAVPLKSNGSAPEARPRVIFVVGVNGTGKTTTIGKLAHHLRAGGSTILLCAGDTFRAAAIEQLAIWAERTGSELIKQKPGADPAAVVYDALTAARARGVDAVIVDTAGRLHTKSNLMAELEKMKRTAAKLVPGAPHDVLLVLDATTGQNGLAQAREFTATAGVTGIVLTKLDGTARGGIVVSIVRELGLPVRFVGTGEAAEDLVPFDAQTFVNSLFD